MKNNAYDTVSYLRPLPQAAGAINHPGHRKDEAMPQPTDHDPGLEEGKVTAEACMKLLYERFPHVQALALKRCEQQESFRELCEEYFACTQVLARLERPNSEESLRSEYSALRLRLEGELLRYIAEENFRAGTPKP